MAKEREYFCILWLKLFRIHPEKMSRRSLPHKTYIGGEIVSKGKIVNSALFGNILSKVHDPVPWTPEEDSLLVQYIESHGAAKCTILPFRSKRCLLKRFHPSILGNNISATILPHRTGKQCRERWYNHLSPDIKKGFWSREVER